VIKFKRLSKDVKFTTATDGSAGFDLHIDRVSYFAKSYAVHTGIAVEIPKGYVGLVCPRSGMAREGWAATLGIIDSDYRGEVIVTLPRLDDEQIIRWAVTGARIAQLVVVPCATWAAEVEELTPTMRGDGGFGSTGK
jgi:dUTP pyrophosphatase